MNVSGGSTLVVKGTFAVQGALNVSQTAEVSGSITAGSVTLNGGELEMLQPGALKVDGDLTMQKGSVLKLRGALDIDGDFNFNGGRVEFIGSNCSVKIRGKVSGSGSEIIGDYSGKIK